MPALRLFLLGSLDIRHDGQQLPKLPTLKSQSLLAYLALHRERPQPRERLAELFWGGRPERKARRSLTTALWHIRRCLHNEDLLLSDMHSVRFDPQADLWLDVAEFESLVARSELPALQSAVDLYRGELMEGFYDDWVLNERYRLETLLSETLAQLMTDLEAREEMKRHSPRRCGCCNTIRCARMRTGWRCGPSVAWGNAARRWSSTAAARRQPSRISARSRWWRPRSCTRRS
jgi:DNA-binding SARP family transcriptional activator